MYRKLFLVLGLLFTSGAVGQDTLTVAVLNFDNNASLDSLALRNLSARFQSSLVKSKAFVVVEREKVNEILKEQDFSLSDFCSSDACAVEVGQLLGVSHIVIGDIAKIGKAFSVNVRLIDVSTGQIINSESQSFEGGVERLLESMDFLARSISGLKPENKTATSALVTIPFTIRRPGKIKITVYNLTGQKVIVLANSEFEAGTYTVSWDGIDQDSKRVKKGVYVYTIESPDGKKNGKFKLGN